MYNLTKEEILQLAKTNPETEAILKTKFPEIFVEIIELSQVRAQLNALSLPGGFGRRLLLSLNNSPFHLFTNKSLLVDKSFEVEIVKSLDNQLLIFKDKS